MMNLYRLMITLLIAVIFLTPKSYASEEIAKHKLRDTVKYDRQYTLETTMLGYIGSDGKRNPTLKASKGELVRIKIVNVELMTHDIAHSNHRTLRGLLSPKLTPVPSQLKKNSCRDRATVPP